MATVGRKPRKRSPSAGTAVGVKSHSRTPRGRNTGKAPVRVKGYKRAKPKQRRRRTSGS